MKKLFSVILFIFLLMSFAQAADILVVPYKVAEGDVISAEDTNARFEAIEEYMNRNLVVMFNYGTPNNITKIFRHTNSPTTSTNVLYTTGMKTWNYADGSKVEHLTADSVAGTMMTGRRMYNAIGVLTQDLTYFPAVLGVDITGAKSVGKVWGNAYIAKKPDGRVYGAEINMYTIIGIETVTIPAGTFEKCIKVFTTTQNYKNVSWYAEGYGLIKRIGVNGLLEMQ